MSSYLGPSQAMIARASVRRLIGLSLFAAVFAGPAAIAADQIPVLNIQPSCTFQSSLQSDRQQGLKSCLEQEQSARAQLEKTWSQFASQDRERCLDMTKEMGGTTASYVEVLECLTMARDAHAYEKKNPSMDTPPLEETTGQKQ
jgi:hypothetical protein